MCPTAEGVGERIRAAKAAGLRVTCDTAPALFCAQRTGGWRIPDLRQALPAPAQRGRSSGHRGGSGRWHHRLHRLGPLPPGSGSQRLPFELARIGSSGLESLLALTLELVHNGHLSLIDALAKVTSSPSALLKLPTGRLYAGAPADLVIFDPDKPARIEPDSFVSKSKNSPLRRAARAGDR